MPYEPPEDGAGSVPAPMSPSPPGDYGYGTPTKSVEDMGGAPGASTNAGGLVETYRRVVLSPSVEVFEDEIPRASWGKTLFGIGIVTATTIVVSAITFYGLGALFPDLYNPTRSIAEVEARLREANILEQWRWLLDLLGFLLGAGGILLSAALTPILFFVGAGALYISSRLFGGRGSDFMTHSYLLSISYTPLRAVSTLAGLVPIVSGFVSLALFLYQLYLAGVSMQASRRMEPGKAMMAAFVPLIALLLLMCVGIIALIAVLAPMIQRR